MFLKIKNLLAPAEIARLSELAAELRFVEGRVSNPANVTKDNLQADPRDAKYAESVQVLQAALRALAGVHRLRDAEARSRRRCCAATSRA